MRHPSHKIAPSHPSASARARSPIRAGADGFGIIELVIAMTIFSILIGGVVVSIGAGLALARNNRERSIAANLAAQEMDAIRQADFTSLDYFFTGLHHAVIRVYDAAGDVIETPEHEGDFKEQ